MTTTNKEPVLVVLQMTGGNDYLNTVVPYADGMYYDYRPTVGVAEEDVIPIDSTVGLHPQMRPFKDAYDAEDLAIIHGVGYANSPRSHFRSMDIWHTCEPDTLGTEGWLGKVVRQLDPEQGERRHGRQHGTEHVPRPLRSGRASRVRRQPR